MGIKWGGMLDIDEFWFSQRFVTLERLLAHKYKLGYHGIGQTSMSFLAGPADGPCSELPPVVATHLWRRCELTRFCLAFLVFGLPSLQKPLKYCGGMWKGSEASHGTESPGSVDTLEMVQRVTSIRRKPKYE
eukprot:6182342-Pleurochrysis_carterae.AAC.5